MQHIHWLDMPKVWMIVQFGWRILLPQFRIKFIVMYQIWTRFLFNEVQHMLFIKKKNNNNNKKKKERIFLNAQGTCWRNPSKINAKDALCLFLCFFFFFFLIIRNPYQRKQTPSNRYKGNRSGVLHNSVDKGLLCKDHPAKTWATLLATL